MDLYQPIAKAIVLPLHALKTRSKYLRYLAEFEKTQYLARENIVNLQWDPGATFAIWGPWERGAL